MFYALIMAGGTGTRLWPLSRQNRPKQALTLVGERTMFQHAVDRIALLFPPSEFMLSHAATTSHSWPDRFRSCRCRTSSLSRKGAALPRLLAWAPSICAAWTPKQ